MLEDLKNQSIVSWNNFIIITDILFRHEMVINIKYMPLLNLNVTIFNFLLFKQLLMYRFNMLLPTYIQKLQILNLLTINVFYFVIF